MANPQCRYFGECGGCSAQHIDYDVQLKNKRYILSHAINFPDIRVFSGKEYHYRNRMDFIFHPRGLGLRMKEKWYKTVDIEYCMIANEKLNELLKEVRQFFKHNDTFNLETHEGTFRYAIIRTPSLQNSISFVLNAESTRIAQATEEIQEFAKKTTADNIIVTYIDPDAEASVSDDFFVVKGEDMLKEQYNGKIFSYSVQSFFQNNDEIVEKMQDYCNSLLKAYPTKDAALWDIYGGVGTFGIINAELFKAVTIIESIKQSIDAAQHNIKENGIKNANAVVLDAKNIRRLNPVKPLYVITDPPRSGMHEKTIETLKKIEPEVIVYISCNTKQLSKDLLKFKKYVIKSAALFDLFPQTPHSEAVVELIKWV
jgi:23S rRNA (uracil-5-)-methyltransferase RumA